MTMNRSFFLINFSVVTLAGFGLEVLKLQKSYLKLALGVVATLLLLGISVFLGKGTLITNDHAAVTLRNLVLPIGLSIVICLIVLINRFIKKFAVVQILLLGLLIFELFRFGWKFNTFTNREYLYPSTPLTDFLSSHKEERFVSELDVLPPDMWVPFHLSSLSGYDSVYPLSSAKILAAINSGRVDTLPQSKSGIIDRYPSQLLPYSGVRYYVSVKRRGDGGIDQQGMINPLFFNSNFKKVFEDKSVVVFENQLSLSTFYWANSVLKTDSQVGLNLLMHSDEMLQTRAAIAEDFSFQSEEKDLGTPANTWLNNSNVLVSVDNTRARYLVFSETYYPGWRTLS